jgi:hypothetical protein
VLFQGLEHILHIRDLLTGKPRDGKGPEIALSVRAMTALAVGYLIFKFSGAGSGRNENSQNCGSKCRFYFARLHQLTPSRAFYF